MGSADFAPGTRARCIPSPRRRPSYKFIPCFILIFRPFADYFVYHGTPTQAQDYARESGLRLPRGDRERTLVRGVDLTPTFHPTILARCRRFTYVACAFISLVGLICLL